MFKLIFTNARGAKIELFSAPFRLSKVEGLGEVESIMQGQRSPFQDGEVYIDSILESRHMAIELKIYGKDAAEIEYNRRFFASVFNPKLGPGQLKYVRGEEVKVIDAVAESVPAFPDGPGNRGTGYQKALLFLCAPNPYWRTPEIREEPAFDPLFQFPFEGEFQMGIQRDQRIIDNDGDSPAPLFIEFHGPAVNPRILNNTTGEFFKVNQTLGEGEVMEIDTEGATVFFVEPDGTRRNVFNWIDDDAVFFKLAIGENDIEYTADSDIQGAVVNISYSKLFTAV